MAEGPDKDQKTEQPTAKKRADSTREGDVLMSRELATALMMPICTAKKTKGSFSVPCSSFRRRFFMPE